MGKNALTLYCTKGEILYSFIPGPISLFGISVMKFINKQKYAVKKSDMLLILWTNNL